MSASPDLLPLTNPGNESMHGQIDPATATAAHTTEVPAYNPDPAAMEDMINRAFDGLNHSAAAADNPFRRGGAGLSTEQADTDDDDEAEDAENWDDEDYGTDDAEDADTTPQPAAEDFASRFAAAQAFEEERIANDAKAAEATPKLPSAISSDHEARLEAMFQQLNGNHDADPIQEEERQSITAHTAVAAPVVSIDAPQDNLDAAFQNLKNGNDAAEQLVAAQQAELAQSPVEGPVAPTKRQRQQSKAEMMMWRNERRRDSLRGMVDAIGANLQSADKDNVTTEQPKQSRLRSIGAKVTAMVHRTEKQPKQVTEHDSRNKLQEASYRTQLAFTRAKIGMRDRLSVAGQNLNPKEKEGRYKLAAVALGAFALGVAYHSLTKTAPTGNWVARYNDMPTPSGSGAGNAVQNNLDLNGPRVGGNGVTEGYVPGTPRADSVETIPQPSGGNAATETITPPAVEAPAAPELQFNGSAKTVWEAMHQAGIADSEILGKLDDAAKASGLQYEWHGAGMDRWLELTLADGQKVSDTSSLIGNLGSYITK